MTFVALLEYFDDPRIAEIYYLDMHQVSLRDTKENKEQSNAKKERTRNISTR